MRLQVITGGLPWCLLVICNWSHHRPLPPWVCMLQTWLASPREHKPCKELFHLINSIQEGFNIKVLTKRKNLNFHPILIRTWVPSFPTMIRIRKSASPVRVRKSASPVWVRISESSSSFIGHLFIFIFIFKIIVLIGGIVQFFFVGEFIKLGIS